MLPPFIGIRVPGCACHLPGIPVILHSVGAFGLHRLGGVWRPFHRILDEPVAELASIAVHLPFLPRLGAVARWHRQFILIDDAGRLDLHQHRVGLEAGADFVLELHRVLLEHFQPEALLVRQLQPLPGLGLKGGTQL